jgi:hypothetical protein
MRLRTFVHDELATRFGTVSWFLRVHIIIWPKHGIAESCAPDIGRVEGGSVCNRRSLNV